MSEAQDLITINNLAVRFRAKRGLDAALSRKASYITAIDDVSLNIEQGEIYGLVGESGSGKTTLGKTILRLVDPSEGSILLDGKDLSGLSERRLRPFRRQLQMVFQDPLSSLNPRQRVSEALAVPLRLYNIVPKDQVDRRVDELLTRVGLSSVFRDRYPHELSGGQLQRVAIGRALALNPRFLVADEAVSKLDVSVRAQILNLFKDIQAETGITMLFITHDLQVARYLCTRIGVMYFGKLVEVGPTEELFSNPRHPYTQALLSTLSRDADQSRDGTFAEEAFNPTEDDRVGCRFYKRCTMRQEHCAQTHPELETVKGGHQVACYEWRRTGNPVSGTQGQTGSGKPATHV